MAATFGSEQFISTTATGAFSISTADVDGDGDLDILAGAGNGVGWYENDGSQGFTLRTIASNAAGVRTVTSADVDGDGDLDILSASFTDNTIAWYQNDGSQNFTRITIATGAAAGAFSIKTVDVDGDGDFDVLAAGNTTVAWYQNDGSGNFTRRTIFTTANTASSVTAADVDGDGDLDVLSTSSLDNTIAWYQNDGSQNFTRRTIATGTNATGAFSVSTADIDGDGDVDAFAASAGNNTIAWYQNDGSGNFTRRTIATNATGARTVFAADIDSDGDFDVVTASYTNNTIAWYENDGSGNFTQNVLGTSATGARSAVAADVDGDGDQDVLAASSTDNTFAWFQNANQRPTAVGDTFNGTEDAVLNGNVLLANPTTADSDPDGNTLTVTAVNGQATNVGTTITLGNGQLLVNSDGTFSFSPGNGYNNLKAGGSAQESFTYTVSDGNGGTNTATVTLNIAGANDAATIGGTATATVTEDATNPNLTATGTLTVTDPDAGENQFSTTVTGANGNLGSLSINSSGAYTYSVANSAVQSLGAKQTKTETFTVQTVDGTTQNVTINIAGVNDAPTVGTGTTTGSVKKSSDKPTGSFNFSDVDLQDSHTLSVTPAGNGYVGNLTPTITNQATGDGAGTVTWSFAVSDSELASLKDNRNQSYTVRISDGQGGSVAQTVTIALQGSDDEPVGKPIGKKGITKNGGNRNDRLTGTNDDDVLNGKGGNDRLVGKAGNDKINAGSGNDIINGGAGADLMVGSSGNDTFQISPLSSSLLSGFDRIQDLVIGQDRIDGPKAVPASKVAKLGAVASFDEAGIQAVLTTGAFKANGAATFTSNSRTFLALNNGSSGFSASTDAIVEITGYKGNLTQLRVF